MIVVPETVVKIGNNAFGSSKISELVIPSSVRLIGQFAFNLSDIEYLKICGDSCKLSEAAFSYVCHIKNIDVSKELVSNNKGAFSLVMK